MELALLVYVISLLEPITHALGFLCFVMFLVMGAAWFGFLVIGFETNKSAGKKWPIIFTVVFLAASTVALFIPSEKTAYLMVGAYATQKIAEAPKTQELGADVLKIIESKIKFYADQSAKELEEKLNKNEVKK